MRDSSDALVEEASALLAGRGWMLATAESCTGGLIAGAITDRPGSSSVFDRGFVTYSNISKEKTLMVSGEILDRHGAVSRECAAAMVHGTLAASTADIALSVTGIAGPGGGSSEKPVGLVYIGCGSKSMDPSIHEHRFSGNRRSIRQQSVDAALRHLIDYMESAS